ncbi:MAG TPA: hypothetical protein PL045_12085, partial [Chitinophagaceae bacterium]|nr:hypothetical protein [Chitinophagaceae bacterium]
IYNNSLKQDDSAYMRSVMQTLKKNRRILQELLDDKDMIKQPKNKLQHKGFQFSYHTHQYTNQKGNIYYFCFEYGYLPLEGDWILIVKRKEEKQ